MKKGTANRIWQEAGCVGSAANPVPIYLRCCIIGNIIYIAREKHPTKSSQYFYIFCFCSILSVYSRYFSSSLVIMSYCFFEYTDYSRQRIAINILYGLQRSIVAFESLI